MIDCYLTSPALAEGARRAAIYKEQWFSDQVPLTVEYEFGLCRRIDLHPTPDRLVEQATQ